MNYDRLSKDEVMNRLSNHDEAEWNDRLWNEVIEPSEVLYYLDAFGDLSLAINCQGLPKDLPSHVVEAVNEHDIRAEWNGKVEMKECATCSRELYVFDASPVDIVIDNFGDDHTRNIEIVGDPAGMNWDASGEYRFMCAPCHQHPRQTFGRHGISRGVKVFYGDDDSWYGFRTSGTVVRHDSWGADDPSQSPRNLRDKDGNLIQAKEIERAFTQAGDLEEMLEKMGWTEIVSKDVRVSTPGLRNAYRYAKDIIEEWAEAPYDVEGWRDTHPDMDFTYIIQNGKHIYCHVDNREEVLYHLEDQVLHNSNQPEKRKEHLDLEIV